MERQQVTLIVGEYRTTRVVEQIASLYSVVQHNPDNIWDRINERTISRWHTHSLQTIPHWLWIFDCQSMVEKEPDCRVLLANGASWLIDILLLDPAWEFSLPLYGGTRWIDQVLRFPLSDGSMLFPTTHKRDPFPRGNLGPVPFGSCVRHKFERQGDIALGYTSSVLRPWQKPWTPEQHKLYPVSIRRRVIFLLMAQRNSNSLFGLLDKVCLMEILCCGAALEE